MSSLTCGRCPATAALALPSGSQMFTGDGLQSLLFPETGAWGLLCLRGRVLKANPDLPSPPRRPRRVSCGRHLLRAWRLPVRLRVVRVEISVYCPSLFRPVSFPSARLSAL